MQEAGIVDFFLNLKQLIAIDNKIITHGNVPNLFMETGKKDFKYFSIDTLDTLYENAFFNDAPLEEARRVQRKYFIYRKIRKSETDMYVENFKTPLLVIHGAYDFRVPYSQAMELFTSLQRVGVESKFLYFPDETHFVTKPQNAKLWWNTIFEWFEHHETEEKIPNSN